MKYLLEYVWLGGNNELRSKTRIHVNNYDCVPDKTYHHGNLHKLIPPWNYDGSSTNQATGENSEIILHPVAFFDNPLELPRRNTRALIVLCETQDKDGKPLPNNFRREASTLFSKYVGLEPWFGLEQEFFILNDEIRKNIETNDEFKKQGQFYCSVGGKNAFLRHVIQRHMHLCIQAGINISGTNAEVAPYQWEFQIGPCTGIEAGDHLWVARYLLERVAEEEGYYIDWSPKPFKYLNGSGCHTNFSTKEMREDDHGIEIMYDCIEKMRENHTEDMKHYGTDNDLRMVGEYETASFDSFKFDKNKSVDRGASVRISYDTVNSGKGYFEDRRPASNMDPYKVTARVMRNAIF